MQARLPIFSLILVLVCIAPSLASEGAARAQSREIAVGHVETLTSEILGETRRLEIRLPADYAESTDSYPVMIVLDGGPMFTYIVSIIDMIAPNNLPEMIVVGLPNTDRRRDLDPVDDSLGEVGAGALRFQRFLGDELLPHLDEEYRTVPFRILAGHSLAGLHTAYSMVTSPGTFQAYLVSSPSLLWGGRGEALHDRIAEISAQDLAGRFIFLSSGGMEGEEFQAAIAELGEALVEKSEGGLRAEWRVYEKEGHIPIPGFYEGLRTLFAGWFPDMQAFRAADWPAIEAHYEMLSDRMGYPVRPPYDVGASVADRLAEAGETAGAITVYETMVEQYPRTHFPRWRLAELTSPGLDGPYLGQTPPGLEPEVFAPGLFVSPLGIAVPPDGAPIVFASWGGQPPARVLVVERRETGWVAPVTAPFSGDSMDWDVNFSPDGRRLYFSSRRPRPGKEDPIEDADIWFVERTDTGWGEPQHVGTPVTTDGNEVHPTVEANGTFYFFGDRGDGQGGADIYVAPYMNGAYLPPENLGPAINTEHNEMDPFVAPDGSYLLFHSDQPGGPGRLNLYISFREDDGSWSQAVGMGDAINRPGRATYCPRVSHDGKYLFFHTVTEDDRAVYWVDAAIIEHLRQ
jgi:predicted alpha/beta superfamily hydrolase